jgi:signal transduction histidine kinase
MQGQAKMTATGNGGRSIGRRFGDLRVRPKLMVVHNLFFLVLTVAVYFSLIPLIETRLEEARRREVNLILEGFQKAGPRDSQTQLGIYGLESGSASELKVPDEVREWASTHPGAIWRNESESNFIYKWDPDGSKYYQLKLPNSYYSGIVESAKLVVFIVLGAVYVIAVLFLEVVILPRYVYAPLRRFLDADSAALHGDRDHEIVEDSAIPGDEIGQIMQSRNATVRDLRKREHDLEETLERLETAKRNLEAQDRLVSLGLLSAGVAHEMNTPLAVLHGSIEKMLETTSAAPARQRLERMIRVTERLRKISEGLLDFARLRTREMGPVEVGPLLEEAWQLVAIDEKAGEVNFLNQTPAGTCVIGNADRLLQVFVNLLRNALNAVPAGGRIAAAARPAALESGPAYSITITDNGPGIPPEVLPEIFEAFVTTRLDARGTGLGLTVAEGIVNQHGGTLAASNCPGGGARLEVRLPAAAVEKS